MVGIRAEDAATLLDARTRYFADNGFGPDGGYSDKWVHIDLGWISLRIPNTPGRVRAVRYHDLHHVVTGYATDMAGESEIAAWELASNCRGFGAAWVLNGGSLAYGLLTCPRRVRAAFFRGLHTKNLYDRDFDDALLERTVADMRRELGLDRDTLAEPQRASVGDRLVFFAAATICLGIPPALLAAIVLAIVRLVT